MDDNNIILSDDEGNEYEFSLLGVTEYEENTYAVFQPKDEPKNPDDEVGLLVMLIEYEGENPIFTSVEDEVLGTAVLEQFMAEEEEQDED